MLRFDKRRDMAGVAVPSLTVTSRMAVRLAGVQLELVPAPGETEVRCSPLQLWHYIDIHNQCPLVPSPCLKCLLASFL